jgi:hypothetical protein
VISQDELDYVVNRVSTKWVRPKGLDAGQTLLVDTPSALPLAILKVAPERHVSQDVIKDGFHKVKVYLFTSGGSNGHLTAI